MSSEHPPQAPSIGSSSELFPRSFLAPLIVGATLNPINTSIIATALSPIARAFDVPVGQTAVLVAGVYLAAAVAQPTMGRLASVFGARRIFAIGIAIAGLGGVVGLVATTFWMLFVARMLIGIGTSAGYPCAMTLIRQRAGDGDTADVGRAIGQIAIAGQATIALGLPLGGVLVGALGWRAVFAINIPVAIIGFVLVRRNVPPDQVPEPKPAGRAVFGAIDTAGIAIFGATVTFLLLFLMTLRDTQWIFAAGFVAGSVLLVAVEGRRSDPFIDLRLFARRFALTAAYVRTLLGGVVVYSVIYGLTQWLQNVKELSPTAAGLVILPTTAVGVFIIRPFSRRNLVRLPLVVVAVMTALAAGGLMFVRSSTPLVFIVLLTTILGAAVALSGPSNQGALYGLVAERDIGTASGLLRTSVYLGAIISSSVIGFAFADDVTDAALTSMAFVLVVCSVLLVVVTFAIKLPRTILLDQDVGADSVGPTAR